MMRNWVNDPIHEPILKRLELVTNMENLLELCIENNYYGYLKVILEMEGERDLDNIVFPNPDNISPLFLASKMGHGECIKVLLDHGSSINFQDGTGDNALMYAVRAGKVDAVSTLLSDQFIDINAKNSVPNKLSVIKCTGKIHFLQA